jgi:hypothetical protein
MGNETEGRDLTRYLAAEEEDWEATFHLLHERIQTGNTDDLRRGDYVVLGQEGKAPVATILSVHKSGILFLYTDDSGIDRHAKALSMMIGPLMAKTQGVDGESSGGRIVAFDGYTPLFFLR